MNNSNDKQTLFHSNIPEELKALKQWCVYRGDKAPRSPRGGFCKSNDESTWASFDECLQAVEERKFDGLGFFLKKPYFGVDIDKADEEVEAYKRGEFVGRTGDIIQTMNSYTEISKSGKGIHIICKGELYGDKHRKNNLEIYQEGRYFIMTGNVIEDKPICVRSDELKAVYTKYMEEQPTLLESTWVPFTVKYDSTLYDMFMEGDWQGAGYGSQSEADLAFCNLLVQKFEGNRFEVEKKFRESGLYRDKWDKRHGKMTYGEATLDKALSGYVKKQHFQDVKNKYTWDDVGNSNRFYDKNKVDMKFCYENGKWCHFNGKYWNLFADDVAGEKAVEVTNDMYEEAKFIEDENTRENFLKFVKGSRSNGRIKSMISLAQSKMSISNNDFDKHVYRMNVENGSLDLKEGNLYPHASEMLETRYSDVTISRGDCPRWIKFLDEIFLGNKELIRYVKKMLGYSLTGDISEQIMFILHGSGNNGKSVFLDVVGHIFGSYSSVIQPETIMTSRGNKSGANSDIARLKGSRLVICSENDEGIRLNEGLVKQLTGGDKVVARFLYGREFEYVPNFKLFLNTNHLPIIRGTDRGIWRRLRIIPFEYNIPANKIDKHLIFKLMEELPQILAWCLEGCLEWQEEGFHDVEIMQKYIDSYQKDMDTIAQFVEECCEVNPIHKEQASLLYQVYAQWAKNNNEYLYTNTKFGREMAKKFEKKHSNGIYYAGLSLKERYKRFLL